MDVHPGVKVPAMLRRCSWCGEAEKPTRKLRKCAACEYAIYCGKTCQRSAWDEHKESCRYMSKATMNLDPKFEAEVRPFGFANTITFSRALNDWIEAHSWALQTFTQALILKLGGVKFLKIPPLFMTCYECVCRNTPRLTSAERNPASTFYARNQGVIKIDEWNASHQTNADFWRDTAQEREAVSKYMEQRCGSAFACVIAVVFKCDGITMCNTMNFPILHTRKRLPLDQASLDILEDVINLCSGSLNKGFPLRCPEGDDSKIPLPGRFSRKAGKWIWEPLFADWDDYSPTSRDYIGLHEVLSAPRRTELPPKQLLKALLTI